MALNFSALIPNTVTADRYHPRKYKLFAIRNYIEVYKGVLRIVSLRTTLKHLSKFDRVPFNSPSIL